MPGQRDAHHAAGSINDNAGDLLHDYEVWLEKLMGSSDRIGELEVRLLQLGARNAGEDRQWEVISETLSNHRSKLKAANVAFDQRAGAISFVPLNHTPVLSVNSPVPGRCALRIFEKTEGRRPGPRHFSWAAALTAGEIFASILMNEREFPDSDRPRFSRP